VSELLDLALTAHGGHDRWRRIHSLEARLSLTGALYKAKGFPDGVPNVTMTVDAHRPTLSVAPYGPPDGRGFFTPDRVWIEDGAGKVVRENIRVTPSRATSGKHRGISSTGSILQATRCGTI
jgi:hypothetical protein